MFHYKTGLLLLIFSFLLSGCSILTRNSIGDKSHKLNDFNVAFGSQDPKQKHLAKKDLVAAIALSEGQPEIRTVELLYRSGESKPYPEYRIFGVQKGGVYDILGLRDSDVIVAADGYILSNGNKFASYVKLLPGVDRATIHFRRGRKPYVYEYIIQN